MDPARPESLAQLTFGHEPSCDPLDDSCGVSGVLPSPDGRHVAFGNGAYCRPGYLYVARADGRAPRRIAPFGACGESGFDWAPDSRRLAYAANGFVYVVGSDGSHRRRVAVGGDPVWSPDGHALAYQDNRYLSVLRNGHRQTIAWNVDDYAWSPNGKWLAIDTHTTYPYSAHLEIIRRDGTGERKLTDSYALSLTWSRDGRFIAYSNSGLNVVDLATGGVRPVGPEHGYRHPWSPRGHLLAFDGEQGLSLFDADTGTTRPLSSDLLRASRGLPTAGRSPTSSTETSGRSTATTFGWPRSPGT